MSDVADEDVPAEDELDDEEPDVEGFMLMGEGCIKPPPIPPVPGGNRPPLKPPPLPGGTPRPPITPM